MIDITTKAGGSSDQASSWILHTSGVPLSTGFRVTMGQTTVTGSGIALAASMLWLDGTGVGIVNYSSPTYRHTQISTASVNRTITYGDADIVFVGYAGKMQPESRVDLATTQSNSTTTPATITGFAFTPVANRTYEVEFAFLVTAAATTTGVRFQINGPAGATVNLAESNGSFLSTLAASSPYSGATNSPTATTPFLMLFKGKVTTSSTVSDFTLSLVSEVGSSSVSILAGSYQVWKPIA
jgi:hypothetical protein